MDIFIVWILLSVICASVGVGRSIGYWGCLFACFFLSPLIGLIIGLVSSRVEEEESIPKMVNIPPIHHKSSADELAKFHQLLKDGAITQAEFDAKKQKLM